jgi:hypothetical protein
MPFSLAEKAGRGQTIIEKFETFGVAASFVIVLLTPDDVGQTIGNHQAGTKPNARARQNVVLELGYFIGKIGRENIVVVDADGAPLRLGWTELRRVPGLELGRSAPHRTERRWPYSGVTQSVVIGRTSTGRRAARLSRCHISDRVRVMTIQGGQPAPAPASTPAAAGGGSAAGPHWWRKVSDFLRPVFHRLGKIIRHPASVIVLVLLVGLVLALPAISAALPKSPLGTVPGSPWVAFLSVAVGAALAVTKELLVAIAQDRTDSTDPNLQAAAKKFTDASIVCSVYAAVFAFPGLVAASAPLIFSK